MALAVYCGAVQVKIPFGTHRNKADIISALNNIAYQESTVSMDPSITHTNLDRSSSMLLLLLFTLR